MGINQTYAVFGLGRYGRSVAKELAENGAEVVAVDNREAVVNAVISEIPYCKCADVTDPEALRQIGIANIDVVIVTTMWTLPICRIRLQISGRWWMNIWSPGSRRRWMGQSKGGQK